MIWLKRCPRCDGDLFENADMYGRYIACLQCGYYLNESEEVVIKCSTLSENGNEKAARQKEIESIAA